MQYLDSTFLLFAAIGVMVLSAIIQAVLKSTVSKYSAVSAGTGLSAEQAVKRILSHAGVDGITIGRVSGTLTDHYNPKTGEINLSDVVYGKGSVAAIAIAAHEAGHAIQNDKGILIYRFRQLLAPVASFCSQAGVWIAMAGIGVGYFAESNTSDLAYNIMTVGIVLYFVAVLFYLVMVPVEYDASNRALRIIKELGLVEDSELRGCKKVLRAAGRTYVIALASSAVTLFRLMAMRGRRRR